MGFDNECILNIQSLPGEYFCPVCRTLIYPNEALQAQCTHLYCKPCLAYVVATTQACPYDGYLVTQADSKPLTESNQTLAETIGKVAVHCLYHRSGCTWQGGLSECISHCTDCTFGNSPVLCNRCGAQIMHRQVQEHAQICPGVQPQAQQAEAQATTVQAQLVAQDKKPVVSAAAPTQATPTVTTAPSVATSVATTAVVAPASAPALAVAAVGQAQTPTAEQWYHQQQQLQYQQYYQQYPGYDPYQQQYQQYVQYQQQPHTQYSQPQMNPPQQVIQSHPQQPQYSGPQPQPQPQPPPQLQPQPQPQPQPQAIQQPLQQQVPPQFQPQLQPQNPQPHVQRPQMQPQNTNLPVHQPHPQAQPQTHPQPHLQMAGQPMVQPQTQPYHAQPLPQQLQPPPQLQTAPQHQQPLAPPQIQHPQQHPHPQPQLQQHPTQLQPHPQSQPPLAQPQPLPHQPPAVTGHQSYPPQQPLQQIPPNTPQQRPMHPLPQPYQQYPQQPVQAQGQFQPQQPHQMMPHAQVPMQIGPQGVPPQGPHMPQQAHHHAPHQGQPIHQQPVMQPHPQQLHPMHPQQQMRPQGSPYMQQPPQQNVTHHPQALAVRPMGPGQSMPLSQQSPGGSGKLVPHALNQQASVQNYPVTGRMPMPSEQQFGSSAAPVPQSGIAAQQVPPPSSLGKDPKISEIVEASKSTQLHAEGAESADLKDPKKDSDSAGDGENNGDVLPNSGKDVLGPAKSESKEVKEEATDHPNEGAKSSISIRSAEGEKGIQSTEVDADGKFVNRAEAENLQPSDGTVTVQSLINSGNIPKRSSSASHENENQALASQGQLVESINNKHAPSHQIPLPGGGVDQGMQQQQPQHHPLAPHQSFPPPHDRNISQFPQQGSGPGLSGPVPGQERYQGQPLPYPNQPNTSMIPHRPPASDNMYSQNLPHHAPGQQRMFQEPPHQMQVHGQPVGPNQMRPPVHNFLEPRPQHLSAVPEPFQPPMGKQPYGPYHSEAPVLGFEAPGVMPSRAPGLGGPPFNRSFDEQGMLQPHASGPRGFPDGPIAQQGTAGAPGQSGMIPQRPPFRPEDQRGWPHPPTRMGTEAYPVRQPGFYDDRQHETHRPVPNEHGQFGQAHVQPTPMGSNGIPRNGPSIGSGFPLGVPDERFNLPEGGFKAAQVEQLRPSLNPGSRIMQFEEDLKKFPRPSHLEGEGPAKFDNYRGPPPFNHDAVPRPLDKVPYSSDGAGSLNSRPLPTTGPFPPRSGAPPSHLIDFGERQWPVPDRSGYGRRGDNDGLGRLPLRTGNNMNGPDILPNVKPRDGEPTSFGGFQSHLRRGDPAGPMNLSPHLRTGELTRGDVNYPNRGLPNEPGYFSSFPLHGDMDSFEHIRMRRSASMGWCRICKIDCETVEGLDQHSQSREHQKMAMDMVMSIKRDSAKRKKINSEGNFPYEDANKMKF